MRINPVWIILLLINFTTDSKKSFHVQRSILAGPWYHFKMHTRYMHDTVRSVPLIPSRREIPSRRLPKGGGILGAYVKGTTSHEQGGKKDNGLRKMLFLPVKEGELGTRPTSPAPFYDPLKSLYRFSCMQLQCRAFLRRSADRDTFVSLS